ncbi:recombination-associated protein RdgC [Chondromyces crocatus]|uniref:Recombination-associated protein RdgC n=1 Tax=Chondromyces crocatus TaxID=52 RepID=A0A0K1ES10_CHOCO|nr:recombination-associated protein RdgC [Chondromyces crocatus]AKT43715.1 uncharacterized protein CMC5_079500 [Chondromyces crocatus]
MGALKGTITYTKLYVRGTLDDSFRDLFVERIRLRAFQPLTIEGEEEQKVGWCSIEDPLDTDLDHNKLYYGSYLNLGLRTDRWVIPGPLLKAHLAEAERAHLQKRGREKLTRREKEEIRTMVSRRLRKQVLPVMNVVDLSWNLDSGVVRFWSQSQRVLESMMELFEDTFSVNLLPESPGASAITLELSEAHARALDAITPTTFHPVFA